MKVHAQMHIEVRLAATNILFIHVKFKVCANPESGVCQGKQTRARKRSLLRVVEIQGSTERSKYRTLLMQDRPIVHSCSLRTHLHFL